MRISIGIILGVVGVLLSALLPSGASAKVICGGLDSRGQPMAACAHKPAKLIGQAPKKCPSGSVLNVKTWACWKKCPSNYKRTLKSVSGGKACIRRASARKSLAKYIPTSRVSYRGCPKSKFQFFNLAKGGTCWSCPRLYNRKGATKITSPKACKSIGIDWETPFFREPGLFGLKGASTVAIDILKKHKGLIDKAIADHAKVIKTHMGKSVPSTFKQTQWKIIRDTPQNSPELTALIFLRMVAKTLDVKGRSKADTDLIVSFKTYVQQRRTHMAADALNMYNAWKKMLDYDTGLRQTGKSAGMGALFDFGTVPPDFAKIATDGLTRQGTSPAVAAGLLATGAGGAATGAAATVFAVNKVKTLLNVFANLRGPATGAIKGAKAAKATLSVAKSLAAGAGPLIIVTAATILAEMAITELIKISEAPKKLKAALADAKKPINLKVMIEKNGIESLSTFWALANNAKGNAPASVLTATKAAYAAKGYR